MLKNNFRKKSLNFNEFLGFYIWVVLSRVLFPTAESKQKKCFNCSFILFRKFGTDSYSIEK